jgi:hypothetical protein
MAADKLEVQFFGDDKKLLTGEVIMSFGLLNALARISGDINRIGIIDIVPDLADEVLFEVLSKRDAKGKKVDPEASPPDLPASEANKVFNWAKEHLMDFFLQRLVNTAELMQVNKTKMESVASSMATSKS